MQIKKEEVKHAIIEAAFEEFKNFGFEQSSIRRIVKAAGTTIGNFYNYFENKEMLFDNIVRETYMRLMHFAENHNDIEAVDDLWSVQDISKWRAALSKQISTLVPMISDAFIILMEGSKGTKYENTREELAQILAIHFTEHVDQFNPEYASKDFGIVLATQLISSIVDIIKRFTEDDVRVRLIVEELLFFIVGIMTLLLPEKGQ